MDCHGSIRVSHEQTVQGSHMPIIHYAKIPTVLKSTLNIVVRNMIFQTVTVTKVAQKKKKTAPLQLLYKLLLVNLTPLDADQFT